MKFQIFLASLALLALFLGESAAVEHALCNGKDYKFHRMEVASAKCSNATGACSVHCTFKELKFIYEDNSPSLHGFKAYLNTLPHDMQGSLEESLKECFHFLLNFPSYLDPSCSQMGPLIKCMTVGVHKRCGALDHSVFF